MNKYINKKYVKGKKFTITGLEELRNEIEKYEYDDTTWAIESYNQQKVAENRNVDVCKILKCISKMIYKIQKIERNTFLRFQFLEDGKYTFYCEHKKEYEKLDKEDINLIWEAC